MNRLLIVVIGLMLACGGCAPPKSQLSTEYGSRRGSAGRTSVNGLAILASMFEQAGWQVSSRGSFSTKTSDVSTILWMPDRFTPPNEDEREEIGDWLQGGDERTFIYVGRDYDAALEYWQDVRAQAVPENVEKIMQREAQAVADSASARSKMPREVTTPWFTARRDAPRFSPRVLRRRWGDDIDAAKANLPIQGRFELPFGDSGNTNENVAMENEGDEETDEETDDGDEYEEAYARVDWNEPKLNFELLLSASPTGDPAEDDPFDARGGLPGDIRSEVPLVVRVTHPYWGDSQLLIVTNGSFLLNYPLVNHQRRRLAGRLIADCGTPGKMAFWESENFNTSPSSQKWSEWAMLTAWPLNVILLHLAVLGFLYVMWRFPIFGRPQELPREASSDFGKHIEAIGDLLATTKNREYAAAKLAAYHQLMKNESSDPK